jgi:hypothetical protein
MGKSHKWGICRLQWLFPLTGFLALLWCLLRVVPKTSRATYPCMRVAAPLASSFVLWIIGIGASAVGLRKAYKKFRGSKIALAALFAVVAWIIIPLTAVRRCNTLPHRFTGAPRMQWAN